MFKNLNNREEFLDFLERHPEIHISVDKKKGGYIVDFPDGAEQKSYTYGFGNITIYYIYKGKEILFPPKEKNRGKNA